MVKIYKIEEFVKYESITNDFILNIDINESNSKESESSKKSKEDRILKNIIKDLKLNFSLVGVFGAGIGAFYPIAKSLMSRMSIEITDEVVILSTICAATIILLEESKIKSIEKQRKIIKDSKTLLEELKLRGVGNGIIKKLITAFYSIKNIFSIIGKHIGAVVAGFTDMFAYTSILIPVMNAINHVIGKYQFTLDNIDDNFLGLSFGIGTIAAKYAIIDVINKIKSKFSINKKKVIDEIETPIIQKFGDKTYGGDEPNNSDAQIIQEQ